MAKRAPKTGEAAQIDPEEVANLRPLEAPWFYASNLRLQGTGNDFNLILQRSAPAQKPDGSVHPTLGRVETVAVLTMSLPTAKDLHLLLGEQIRSHEEAFGTIDTPFTKRRAAEQKTKP